jgi:hypothetical protein
VPEAFSGAIAGMHYWTTAAKKNHPSCKSFEVHAKAEIGPAQTVLFLTRLPCCFGVWWLQVWNFAWVMICSPARGFGRAASFVPRGPKLVRRPTSHRCGFVGTCGDLLLCCLESAFEKNKRHLPNADGSHDDTFLAFDDRQGSGAGEPCRQGRSLQS